MQLLQKLWPQLVVTGSCRSIWHRGQSSSWAGLSPGSSTCSPSIIDEIRTGVSCNSGIRLCCVWPGCARPTQQEENGKVSIQIDDARLGTAHAIVSLLHCIELTFSRGNCLVPEGCVDLWYVTTSGLRSIVYRQGEPEEIELGITWSSTRSIWCASGRRPLRYATATIPIGSGSSKLAISRACGYPAMLSVPCQRKDNGT